MKLPRELLEAIVIAEAVIIAAIWADGWPSGYFFPKAPHVQSEQKTENPISGDNRPESLPASKSERVSNPQAEHGSKDASEVTVIGIKPGEWLIGILTFMLWRVTYSLVRDGRASSEKQIKIIGDEFVATHRPRIGVRFFETFNQPLIGLQFAIVNQGETPATITAIAAHFVQGVAAPTGVMFIDEVAGFKLESGESEPHSVQSSFPNPNHSSNKHLGLPPTFCVGRIKYTDLAGVTRETGFCRMYALVGDTWNIPSPYPEYEYAY